MAVRLEIGANTPWEEVKSQLDEAGLDHFDEQNGAQLEEFLRLRQRGMRGNKVNGETDAWAEKAEQTGLFDRRGEAIRAITEGTIPPEARAKAERIRRR